MPSSLPDPATFPERGRKALTELERVGPLPESLQDTLYEIVLNLETLVIAATTPHDSQPLGAVFIDYREEGD